MLDPFKLTYRLVLAGFKITGYFISYGMQALWYLLHRTPERIGDAIGEMGRSVTDAIADIFRD